MDFLIAAVAVNEINELTAEVGESRMLEA